MSEDKKEEHNRRIHEAIQRARDRAKSLVPKELQNVGKDSSEGRSTRTSKGRKPRK